MSSAVSVSSRWREAWQSSVLARRMGQDQDNFLLLRCAAATAVIFGHCYALKAGPFEQDFIAHARLGPGIYLGSLAVDVFFFVSGFLVAGSWFRQQSLQRFVKARAVRILPAYWALLLLTVVLFGPWVSTQSIAQYFGDWRTWDYLLGNLRYAPRWALPGVFEQLPYANVVNGSLWSLRVEVLAYLALAGAGVLGLLANRRWFVAACLAGLLALHHLLPVLGSGDYLWPLTMFAFGSTAWVLQERLPVASAVLIGLIGLCWACTGTAAFRTLLAVTLAYGCLWFAYVPRLWWFNRLGDYSYGLYLYAFPIQQWVIWMWQIESVWLQFLIAGALTLLCAIASWHWIESPCLQHFRSSSRLSSRSPPK